MKESVNTLSFDCNYIRPQYVEWDVNDILRWDIKRKSQEDSITLFRQLIERYNVKMNSYSLENAIEQAYLTLLDMMLDHNRNIARSNISEQKAITKLEVELLKEAISCSHLLKDKESVLKAVLTKIKIREKDYNDIATRMINGRSEYNKISLNAIQVLIENNEGIINTTLSESHIYYTHTYTILHRLLEKNKLTPLAEYVINKGADVKALDSCGNNMLHALMTNEELDQATRLKLVDLLVEKGVDINAKNNSGATPLDVLLSSKKLWSPEEPSSNEKAKIEKNKVLARALITKYGPDLTSKINSYNTKLEKYIWNLKFEISDIQDDNQDMLIRILSSVSIIQGLPMLPKEIWEMIAEIAIDSNGFNKKIDEAEVVKLEELAQAKLLQNSLISKASSQSASYGKLGACAALMMGGCLLGTFFNLPAGLAVCTSALALAAQDIFKEPIITNIKECILPTKNFAASIMNSLKELGAANIISR